MEYRIKEFRQKKKVSQEEMANALGISRTYLSQIENGVAENISTKTLVQIAKYLEKPIDEILIMQ